MKKILETTLAILAKGILKKYKPKVIGITGSIGKTSTKEAIYSVLKNKFRVRKTFGNYNNELGLPLTIIGMKTGGRSVGKWLSIIGKALKLVLIKDKKYPEVLVLEMGADKPGDIEHLIKIAPCDIGVVTAIAPVHLEFFGSVEKIVKEKKKIVDNLTSEQTAILNYDDKMVKSMNKDLKASTVYFGYSQEADVRMTELETQGVGVNIEGLKFKLEYKGSSVPMMLPHVIGKHQLYAAMSAAAVGLSMGMNFVQVSEGLRDYRAPRGRMNLIKGKKQSLIVDDTYNSSPDAALAAVDAVANFNFENQGKKIAILGDMLELGAISEQAHYDLGKSVVDNGFSILIAVGKCRDNLIKGAVENGMDAVFGFNTSEEAIAKAQEVIDENDIILIKGSQGVRMEKIVKSVMLESDKSKDLLIRQSDAWLVK